MRTGLVIMRARGPARYYGGEAQAAAALLAFAATEGEDAAQVGIADGRFTAEQAAYSVAHGLRIVDPGASAEFLSPLPIDRCAGSELTALLDGLGIRTLGAFAELPESAVRARFGPDGLLAQRRARGLDAATEQDIAPHPALREFGEDLDFEPPLVSSDQLAFACSDRAERLTTALAAAGLVCTVLRITLTDDTGARHEREWAHPGFFTPADIVSRLRWQAEGLRPGPGATHSRNRSGSTRPQGVPGPSARGPREEGPGANRSVQGGSGISAVSLTPTRTAPVAVHEPGLWHAGPDERVHHHLSRAQGVLGPRGAMTASLTGGRLLFERQRFTPWGVSVAHGSPRSHGSHGSPRSAQNGAVARHAGGQATGQASGQPSDARGDWPGALPSPHPSLVFSPPLRARLLNAAGGAIAIDADDLLDGVPQSLAVEGHDIGAAVRAWSRPWPIRERWWEGRPERFRMQVELADGDAWLLLASGRAGWYAEGRYD